MNDLPPDYDNDELAQLLASLSDLRLAPPQQETPPRPPFTTPIPISWDSTSPHANLCVSFANQICAHLRLVTAIMSLSPKSSSLSRISRSEAAEQTQGVPGGRVRRVDKPPTPGRQKKRGYVVFYGRIPGVYAHWNGPHGAEAQVKGIKGSLYQGYTLLDNATEAFNYARARGWTAPRTSRPPSPSSTSAIVTLPTPSASPPASGELTHAALYEPGSSADSKWHIVYAGITPGIYRSFLECALNTIGLSCAVYDSPPSRTEAIARWQEAVDAGRVRTLTHPYIVQ
ncbi:hypothetical protein DFH09DRAFT_1349428 [Mycena vulgaris]|nr:hypothetical protein DFH09DRAFT_1349428 [Mycena vulgaris]